jgi:hypothetical protein
MMIFSYSSFSYWIFSDWVPTKGNSHIGEASGWAYCKWTVVNHSF